MSTPTLTAGEVMDRSAALMNDPAKTDYTYAAQLPYLNMAIDEMMEALEESNSSPTNYTSTPYLNIIVPIGTHEITPSIYPALPHYPDKLIEIQEVAERLAGTTGSFVRMVRREFITAAPATSSFMYWAWEDQTIRFNPNGATTIREIQLKYIDNYITSVSGPSDPIGIINARSFLTYKTAALCAHFIGENENRAGVLNIKAKEALERMINISTKGRQQIMTRHRPFRASYKSHGGF